MAGAAAKRARAGGGSVHDWLSALPDELLYRVLSFLPSQQVVRTTVLSTRWTDLWRSVPRIDLDFWDFRRGSNEDWAESWERMEDFANNLLMLHRAPCLDAFRLNAFCDGHDHRRHVDRWVRRAIKDNPLVLEVSVLFYTSYHLPHLGTSACRRLKRLQLIGMSLDHSFAERLHCWWPDLEDLNLNGCWIGFCGIESDKLESLAVNDCTNQPDMFVIRAPRLASLHLDIPFSLDAGNSLVRASISLEHDAFSPRSEAMLLGSLFSVTGFELKGFQAMAVLDEEFDEVPIFDDLRTLTLDSCFLDLTKSDVCKFKALGRFLQKCPNLEKLTLKHFKVSRVIELVEYPALESLIEYPTLESLRTLFLNFYDLHDNFGLLHHCLRNSPNLEKLTVGCCKMVPLEGKELPSQRNHILDLETWCVFIALFEAKVY